VVEAGASTYGRGKRSGSRRADRNSDDRLASRFNRDRQANRHTDQGGCCVVDEDFLVDGAGNAA